MMHESANGEIEMAADIKTLGSRIVYENRWMRVREDRIARLDGGEGIYGIVEKPDFAIIAAINDGVIHLVQQYRYPVRGRYWELPQGSWEHAPDTDPADLARAELREETGLEADEMIDAGHLFVCHGYSRQGYHVFLARGLTAGATDLDPEEQDLISRPFHISTVLNMVCDGTIKDAATVAALGLLRFKELL